VTINTARFALPSPEDTDSPNGPAEFAALTDVVEDRLGYAGAQGGASVIPDEQNRSNTAYGLLGAPDRVQGVVIERAGDILLIDFHALWHCITIGGGSVTAAIFIGSNQLKKRADGAVPAVQEVTLSSTGGYTRLYTSPGVGLASAAVPPTDEQNVTTGLIAGSEPISIDNLAPGTYDVSVQFKTGSGKTVEVKERRLRAWTREFPSSGV
jgi:hypothetical protein